MSSKLFFISNYNSDCSWILNYKYDYLIFDRSDTDDFIFDKEKTIKTKNVGHNVYDYCDYFYKYYDNLYNFTCLLKGNMFYKQSNDWFAYKYITKEKFDTVIHNEYYTLLNSWPHNISDIGGYLEPNNITPSTWNLINKYFSSYNEFMNFIFKNYTPTQYTHFSPGACYIVPKQFILKYPKLFWHNLSKFVTHGNNPFESHLLERMLHTLFTEDYIIQDYMFEDLKIT